MHGHKNAIDPDEGNPEVDFAKRLVHEAAEHFRKPEVGSRKHTEYRSHSHYQMEMRQHKVSIVHRQIQRSLTQYQTGDAASNEERNKANGKQHWRSKANLPAPKSA